MKNFIQIKGTLDVVVAGSAVVAGQALVIGSVVGVAMKAGAIGDTVAFLVEGVVSLPKTAGNTPAQGAKLYWDDTAKSVTTTVGANLVIGFAFVAALAGDATVQVVLNQV